MIDDNRDSVDALALLLEAKGHQVRVAYDGPSAIEIAVEFRPEAALVALGLPVMGGYEVARRLKELLPNIVLIALTGGHADQAASREFSEVFERYVEKPIEAQHLATILENL